MGTLANVMNLPTAPRTRGLRQLVSSVTTG